MYNKNNIELKLNTKISGTAIKHNMLNFFQLNRTILKTMTASTELSI